MANHAASIIKGLAVNSGGVVLAVNMGASHVGTLEVMLNEKIREMPGIDPSKVEVKSFVVLDDKPGLALPDNQTAIKFMLGSANRMDRDAYLPNLEQRVQANQEMIRSLSDRLDKARVELLKQIPNRFNNIEQIASALALDVTNKQEIIEELCGRNLPNIAKYIKNGGETKFAEEYPREAKRGPGLCRSYLESAIQPWADKVADLTEKNQRIASINSQTQREFASKSSVQIKAKVSAPDDFLSIVKIENNSSYPNGMQRLDALKERYQRIDKVTPVAGINFPGPPPDRAPLPPAIAASSYTSSSSRDDSSAEDLPSNRSTQSFSGGDSSTIKVKDSLKSSKPSVSLAEMNQKRASKNLSPLPQDSNQEHNGLRRSAE
jgi:hypothetical protein